MRADDRIDFCRRTLRGDGLQCAVGDPFQKGVESVQTKILSVVIRRSGRLDYTSFASMVMVALSSFEMGQPAFALAAAS